jgi:DNA polymerase-4
MNGTPSNCRLEPKASGQVLKEGIPVRPLILHVDMDAFFASVETRSDPRLAARPLAVEGGPGPRGVVTTASYPAREFGVRSGMSMAEALRLCPGLLVLPVDPPKYIHESLAVLAVLDRFSPRVEPASIDEAYLELPPVPESQWERRAAGVAEAIRGAVSRERGLSCSVGAAANKLGAKMVSALAKPGGVRAVPPEKFLVVFGEKPVSVIPGVGPRTTEELAKLGIATVGDLSHARPERLRPVFGRWSAMLPGQASGEGAETVIAAGEEAPPKSAGHETTFARDVADAVYLRATIWLLADRVARRLRLYGLAAGVAAVRFKVGVKRYSRQRSLAEATAEASVLAHHAWVLLESARRGRALRLVGVAGMALTAAGTDEPLLPEDRRRRERVRVSDRLRDRFGEGAILPAGVFLRKLE